jgi:phosphoribosylformylglycinamidine synthase subunit PurS
MFNGASATRTSLIYSALPVSHCSRAVQWGAMHARVYVSLRPSVLDPQGQTIHAALVGLGHRSIAGVRQGKFFDIELAAGADRAKARDELEQIARDVLANPVIEDFRVELID